MLIDLNFPYMNQVSHDQKSTARLAGLLYLIMGVTGAYGMMYVPGQIGLKGDVGSVAQNVLANEFLFRTAMASLIASAIASIFCVLLLYKLLSGVNLYQAKVMVAFVFAQVPIFFLLETINFTALMAFKGKLLGDLSGDQLQILGYIFLKTHDYGILLLEIFWGLWLFPLAILIWQSGFIPRSLGVLLFIVAIGYTCDSLASVLFPAYRPYVQPVAFIASGIGELAIILWLLIKGVHHKPMAMPV